MKLEGGISKTSGNIRKKLGVKIANAFYGGGEYEAPQIEKLLNMYSLIGPEYINESILPLGTANKYGNHGNIET